MPEVIQKSLAVLIAAQVDDILVLRRLLRDTSYRVDPATIGDAGAARDHACARTTP